MNKVESTQNTRTNERHEMSGPSGSIIFSEMSKVNRSNGKLEDDLRTQTRELTERLKQLTSNMEALTVPVTIGPVIPICNNKVPPETTLTVPMATAIPDIKRVIS